MGGLDSKTGCSLQGQLWASREPTQHGVSRKRAWCFASEDGSSAAVAVAFLIPRDVRGDESPKEFLVSIQEVQTLTGLDLFHELPNGFELTFESTRADRIW